MINQTLIKVCGMTEARNIQDIESLKVDMIGFIFYPNSPRYVSEMPAYLPTEAGRVGVFVNESKENVRIIADRYSLDIIQLHGKESPGYCRSLRESGMSLMKAFSISTSEDLKQVSAYENLCQYYLFDTKCKEHGGSGHQFDWSILNHYHGSTPFLLSGGINLYSVRALKEFRHPQFAGIDINSRFETSPGIKDIERVSQFLKQIAL